jgi:SAM-dependent methyltransferase
MPREVPLPPIELTGRVGRAAAFEEIGRLTRVEILARLPEGWSFTGKRVLDFGCGAGRTLRHFLDEARVGELHGCDIDGPSIAWLAQHMSPPLQVFRNEEAPPLPLDDDSFDLVWAISVFTHISGHWSAWLVELHRILRDGGLLIATIAGPDRSQEWARVPAGPRPEEAKLVREADRVGMNVLNFGRPWEDGGPIVFHSEWWLREHWGRAFDVRSVEERGVMLGPQWNGQGVVVLRKRAVDITVEELERIDPADAREIEALRHNIRQLHHESLTARDAVAWLQSQLTAAARPPDRDST